MHFLIIVLLPLACGVKFPHPSDPSVGRTRSNLKL